jgi:PAS domain S-box-containing protein
MSHQAGRSETAAPAGPTPVGSDRPAGRGLAAPRQGTWRWPRRPFSVRFPCVALRWRLMLLVLVPTIPALLLFLEDASNDRAALVAEAEQKAMRLARVWADNHDGLLREAHLFIEAVAARAQQDPTGHACAAWLSMLTARAHWPGAVAIIGRSGARFCTSPGADLALNRLSSGFLEDVFDSQVVQVSEFQLAPGNRSFAFAALSLPAAGDGVERAVVVAIELAEIQRRTTREAEGAQYNLMVIDRTGRLLARDPEEAGFVGMNIGASHPLMPGLMVQSEGTAVGQGLDGVGRLFAFTQLPQTGAKLAIGLSRDDVLGVQERQMQQILIWVIVMTLMSIGAAYALAELSIVRWVRVLSRSADALGRGEAGARARVPRGAGEFAQLARAFNRMAARLASRRNALEKANDDLAASETRFRDIAEIASDVFWERDLDGRYRFSSDRLANLGSLSPELLFDEDDTGSDAASSDARRLHDAIRTRQPFRELTVRVTLPDGGTRWWRLSGKPLHDAATGAFVGFRGAGSDVTAARRAEEELRETKAAAEAASRAKSDFLATMSHELRTPLNAIIGFSEVMHTELLGPVGVPAYRGYVGDILGSGRHLLAIINDILDFAKLDSGNLSLDIAEVDPAPLVAEVVRLLQPQAKASAVALTTELPTEAIAVPADARRLRQILLNLIGNALKFTAAGGTVSVALHCEANETVFVVRDSGIGIAEDDLTRILQPFQQAESSLARRHEGTGLGLAITDRLVRLHGGRLELSSRVGEGTTAKVWLPGGSAPTPVAAARRRAG